MDTGRRIRLLLQQTVETFLAHHTSRKGLPPLFLCGNHIIILGYFLAATTNELLTQLLVWLVEVTFLVLNKRKQFLLLH